ncbi:MAG: hypothetical protein ACF8TS_17140 [Maioricimonas sp. JB049]
MQNTPPAAAAVASVMLFIGIGGLLLLGIERIRGLPWDMPRFWYTRGLIVGGLFAIATVCGAMMQWRLNHPHTDWTPRELGPRFESLVLYTRQTCPLCEEARAVLSEYRQFLPPVVEVDGRVRFRGRVSEPLLRRLIDGAPVHE